MIILSPVPTRIKCGLDSTNSIEVQKKMDDFFLETKRYLINYIGESPHIEIKSKEMELSNNRLTYLLYEDKCVAGVFERRTEFNNLEYIFFRDLTQIENKVKDIKIG
jgi:hypothetical protein